MPVHSKMESWRAAEVDLTSASKEYCRILTEDRERLGLDDTHIVLLMARKKALDAMHAALEEGLLELSGVYWTAWQRRVIDFERRIVDSSRRTSTLEGSLVDATAQRAVEASDDDALRNEQHLLGLYKHELRMLLERPKYGARLGLRAEIAAEEEWRRFSWTRGPDSVDEPGGLPSE